MLAKLKTTLSNLKLSRQIGILLSLVLLGGVLLSSISLDIILKNIAQAEVVIEAEGLLRMTNAIRGYTSEQVFPQLVKRSETEFLPQSIPSFAMREIFQIARKDPAWQDYFYKDATLNPTNLRDKADSFETEIVNHFRQDNNLKELSGIQSTPSGKLFYLAQPIKIEKASCLECHTTPDKAPKTMIERYGSANGFGWQLNEIVGARMIYVPA